MQGSAPRSGRERKWPPTWRLQKKAMVGMERRANIGLLGCIHTLYVQCSRRRADLFDGLNAAHSCYHGIRHGRIGACPFSLSSGLDLHSALMECSV